MHYTKQELDLVTKDENPICLSRHFSGMDYDKDLTSRLFLPSSISFSFLMQMWRRVDQLPMSSRRLLEVIDAYRRRNIKDKHHSTIC